MCLLNRVLTIDELQDFIRRDLSHKDIKACTLVCREWNRLWGRVIWNQIRLFEYHHKDNFLQRHGTHIERLGCEFVNGSVITAITQFCPTLRSLYLDLDRNSTLIQADALEDMFVRIGVRLTKVHIRMDASFVNPAVLWGLSRLGQLRELFLDPYCSKNDAAGYSREVYMSVLHVCANLQAFICGECFWELKSGSSQSRIENEVDIPLVKKDPQSKVDRGPVSLFTTLSRRVSSSSQTSLNRQVVPPVTVETATIFAPLVLVPTFTSFSLRHLHVQSNPLDIIAFHRLIGLTPQLEELIVSRGRCAFTRDTWTVLADSCPRLRLIRLESEQISLNNMMGLASLLSKFSRLECLEFIDCMFDNDPDFKALGLRLEELCRQRGGIPHPLKKLQLTGAIDQSSQVLADVLSLESYPSSFQSLIIGKTASRVKCDEDGRPLIPNWEEQPVDFSTIPPHSLSTLQVLDISRVDFTEQGLFQLFPLIALHASHLHSFGISPSQIDSIKSYKKSLQVNKTSHLDFSLPVLRTVLIGCLYSRNRHRNAFDGNHMRVLMWTAPGLRKVGIRPGIGALDLDNWRRKYWRVKVVVLTPSQARTFF